MKARSLCQCFHHRWSLLAALAGVLLLESGLGNESVSAVIGSSAHGQQISSFCALHNASPWPCRHLYDKGFWNITRVGNKHHYSFVYFKGGCDTRPFLPQHSVVNREANPSEDHGNLHVLMIGDSTDRMVLQSVCELNDGKKTLLNPRNFVCELPMGVTLAHFYIFGIEDPALGNTAKENGYVMDEDKPFGLKTSQRLERMLSSRAMEALHNRVDVVTVQSCLWDLSEPLNILSTVRPEYVAYYRRQIAEVGRVLTQYFPGAQRYWKTSGAVASWYSRDTDPAKELEMFEKGRSRRRRKNKSRRWTTAATRTRRSQVALTNAAYMAVVEDGNSGFRGLVDAFALTEGVTWFAPDGRHYGGLLNKIYFEHLLNRVCTELAEDEAMPSPQ